MLERSPDFSPQEIDKPKIDLETVKKQYETFIEAQTRKATFFERQMGKGTTAMVEGGKTNTERYESFSTSEKKFTDNKILIVAFAGIGDVNEDKGIAEKGFAGIPTRAPGKLDAIPQIGKLVAFHGPTAIAGYTPEQCIKATEAVMDRAMEIINQHPGYKVWIYCHSAGTHLGPNLATRYAKETGDIVDKIFLISPGESIAKGIYSTPITRNLAEDLLERGITKEEYHKAIRAYTQEQNVRYLPSGRNLVIHAGELDTFVPTDQDGGTDDYVERLKAAGKEPTYVKHPNKDHITLPGALLAMQYLGKDPYNLKKPRSVWENKKSFEDGSLIKTIVGGIMSKFSDEELKAVAHVLGERANSDDPMALPLDNLSGYERAIAEALSTKGLAKVTNFGRGPASFMVSDGQGKFEDKIQAKGFLERRQKRSQAIKNLDELVRDLEMLEQNESFQASYEATPETLSVNLPEEIKKLDLTMGSYLLIVEDDRMDIVAQGYGSDAHLVVTQEEYVRLKESGWKEQTYEDAAPALVKGRYYTTAVSQEILRDKMKHAFIIDGIPVANREDVGHEEMREQAA